MALSWGKEPHSHFKIFNPELFMSKGKEGTKSGAETERKAIQRPLYHGIRPICRHQTQTLLLMPSSACWEEPVTAVSWEALLDPEQYRCGCSQPPIEQHRETNGGIRGRTEGAEGVLSVINGRGGPWSCKGLMPQCRGMLGWWGGSGWVEGEAPSQKQGKRDRIRGLQTGSRERG